MSEIAHSAVGDVPIDSFKADSHNGGKDAWVCTRCGKVKDLRGDHLRGKMEVRSDCWPCGKKATFKLQSRLSDDGSNNNVPAASTVDDTHQPKGVGNATIVGGFRAPVVPSTGDEHQFLFPAPVLQCSTPSLSADCSSVWKCSTCGKVKPLSGDHLRGKTEVRSDCWPCGCKRTFVLSPVDGEYGCSALPKEDASKTISKASENVKEQATTGAQIPVQPAATPFKSVFGTQSSGDAKPPAATPFKSVFGTQSSGDANCRGGVVSICLDGESSVTNSASSSCRSTVQANILHDSVGGGVACVADDLSGYQSNSLDEALNVTGLSPLFSAFERMMNDAKEKVLSALKEELNQMVSCVGGRDCCKCGRAIQSGREVKENYRGRNKSGDKIMWAHLENAFTKPY